MSRIMLRALMVSPFMIPEMPADRTMQIARALANNIETDILTADFCHHRKQRVIKSVALAGVSVHSIRVPAYYSNMGARRALSHLVFILRAYIWLRRNRKQYDVVYCTAPFALLAVLLFRAQPNSLRILDVVDLWPDSLPFPRVMTIALWPMFVFWRTVNRMAPRMADRILSGSTTFIARIREAQPGRPERDFHFIQLRSSSPPIAGQVVRQWSGGELVIAYVGNMGALIDWDSMLDAIVACGLTISIQIIGDGDARPYVCGELKRRGIPFTAHGIVYDADRLKNILVGAHFGYNGYSNTDASFSYKAATYLEHGLPMLNSMHGDLAQQIAHFGSGINFHGAGELTRALAVMTPGEFSLLSQGVLRHGAAQGSDIGARDALAKILDEHVHAATSH